MTFWQAAVLAVIEGITEFLPISSTGHMIIASSAMGIAHAEFTKVFIVCIQFGAILSVVALYWRRFFQSFDFYAKLLVAFLPAAVFGKLFAKRIDAFLDHVVVVAAALFIGGVVLIFIDRFFQRPPEKSRDLSYASAFKIGLFQTIAFVPGVSRAAATIIGGLFQGLDRKSAAEFSFLLAVPTMLAATLYKFYQFHGQGIGFSGHEIKLLILGNAVAFIVAWLAVKSFIGYLGKHGFQIFGYYRVLLGGAILVLKFAGFPLSIL